MPLPAAASAAWGGLGDRVHRLLHARLRHPALEGAGDAAAGIDQHRVRKGHDRIACTCAPVVDEQRIGQAVLAREGRDLALPAAVLCDADYLEAVGMCLRER